MTFMPQIEGAVAIRSTPGQLVQEFRTRISAGIFGQRSARANYRLVQANPDEFQINAAGWLTAINVGLNDATFRFSKPGVLEYNIRFWRWAAYVIGLSGLIGVIGAALAIGADARGYIARHAASRFPGLSVDANLVILWAFIVFWGFVWPWLLIALHKVPLRRLVIRLVTEVDDAAVSR